MTFWNYETGWNFETLNYQDFWTLNGFMSNLFFNGWHPVIPWITFFIFGIFLSRLRLDTRKVQLSLVVWGVLVYSVVSILSKALTTANLDAELIAILGTAPVPATPFYVLVGAGFASALIGVCLLCVPYVKGTQFLAIFTRAGRQTLTLYIAHIYIGMGVLEYFNLMGGQSHTQALIASALFCLGASLYAYIWAQYFKRGPLEALMRKLT